MTEPGSTATADELTSHVANLLTKHKRPRELHFLEQLPRNAMGKVMKREPDGLNEPSNGGGASSNPKRTPRLSRRPNHRHSKPGRSHAGKILWRLAVGIIDLLASGRYRA